jgi:hypothetical protein
MLNATVGNPDRLVFLGCMLCVIVLAGIELMR